MTTSFFKIIFIWCLLLTAVFLTRFQKPFCIEHVCHEDLAVRTVTRREGQRRKRKKTKKEKKKRMMGSDGGGDGGGGGGGNP